MERGVRHGGLLFLRHLHRPAPAGLGTSGRLAGFGSGVDQPSAGFWGGGTGRFVSFAAAAISRLFVFSRHGFGQRGFVTIYLPTPLRTGPSAPAAHSSRSSRLVTGLPSWPFWPPPPPIHLGRAWAVPPGGVSA